jgi:hypothetical protein
LEACKKLLDDLRGDLKVKRKDRKLNKNYLEK